MTAGTDLLEEHLGEIRNLRQRLEESICIITTACGSSWNTGSAPLPAEAVGEAQAFLFLVVIRELLKVNP